MLYDTHAGFKIIHKNWLCCDVIKSVNILLLAIDCFPESFKPMLHLKIRFCKTHKALVMSGKIRIIYGYISQPVIILQNCRNLRMDTGQIIMLKMYKYLLFILDDSCMKVYKL